MDDNNLNNVEMKSHSKKGLIIAIMAVVIVALVAAIVVIIQVSGKSGDVYTDKMDLGRKYLTDLDYEQAIVSFEEAIKIEPKNAEAYLLLAEAYEKHGEVEKAKDVLKKAEENVETSREKKLIEEKKSQIEDIPGEEEKYDKLIKQGEQFFDDGDIEKAIAAYEDALDVDPKQYKAYVGLFDIYMAEKEYSPAKIVVDGGLKEVESKSGQMKLEMCRDKLESIIVSDTASGNQSDNQESTVTDASDDSSDADNTDDDEKPNDDLDDGIENIPVEKTDVYMNIRQIDNSRYPEITVYADITDLDGENIENLKKSDIYGEEIDRKGGIHKIKFSDIRKVIGQEAINVNLVVDKSGSMSDNNNMQKVKNSINSLIDYMDMAHGDRMEIMSFDDYVYLEQAFTTNKYDLKAAVNGLYPDGMTALYDAIYSSLYQTFYEEGAKCVIAFTDGMENYSSYTYDDIVRLSKATGIPVYIVGVGEEYDANVYMSLAAACGGAYYSAYYNDLERVLSDIYINLYTEQQDYYALKFNTKNKKDTANEWTLILKMSDESQYDGTVEKKYFAKADMSGAFSDQYYNVDYVLDFSSNRQVKEKDLEGLSLAELRIARNEIFARHGRQFKDPMLNQWFYSKKWYLGLRRKYSPEFFDDYSPDPLSSLENKNVNFIVDYEKKKMEASDIFPNASYVELSGYDMALTKDVLKKALKQMKNYKETDILKANRDKIQEVIDKEIIKY